MTVYWRLNSEAETEAISVASLPINCHLTPSYATMSLDFNPLYLYLIQTTH